jgi:phosphoribosylformylglycinamidine synthase
MAIGGRLGCAVDLAAVPADLGLHPTTLLYSESASRLLATVKPENKAAFEALFANQRCALLGKTDAGGALRVSLEGKETLCLPVDALAQAWKAPLDW